MAFVGDGEFCTVIKLRRIQDCLIRAVLPVVRCFPGEWLGLNYVTGIRNDSIWHLATTRNLGTFIYEPAISCLWDGIFMHIGSD